MPRMATTARCPWGAADDVGVSVGCTPDDARRTDIGVRDGRVYVDRGPSDRADCSFLPYWRAEAPIDPAARRVRLRIEVDTQSVEVFVDDGGVVLSQQVHFEADDAVVRLYAHGGPPSSPTRPSGPPGPERPARRVRDGRGGRGRRDGRAPLR